MAAKVLPSVVTLQFSDGDNSQLGSGVILTADGLIMTNNHVVARMSDGRHAPASTAVTLNDGRTAAFDLIATDPKSDIAIGRARDISGLTPIAIGSSTKLRVGQPVAAVGSPLGLRGTVTAGIVSALNRLICPVTEPDAPLSAYYAIQTDAAINPGNSGGALVDMNGALVGINAAEAVVPSAEGAGITAHGSIGLNYAIPIDHATRIAAELAASGRASHGWLGVQATSDGDALGAKDHRGAGRRTRRGRRTTGRRADHQARRPEHRKRRRPDRRGAIERTRHHGDHRVRRPCGPAHDGAGHPRQRPGSTVDFPLTLPHKGSRP